MRLRDYFLRAAEEAELEIPSKIREGRRVARGFIWIATLQLIFVSAVAISHYGFGTEIHYKNRLGTSGRRLATAAEIASILAVFLAGDLCFIGAGVAILRRTAR